MDYKQTPEVSLIKSLQSRSQKTIQPKQPPSFSPSKHQIKKTPEFPGQSENTEKTLTPSPLTSASIQSTLTQSVKNTPSGSQKTLFPAKSSSRLTKFTTSNTKFNPKVFTPVLSTRRQSGASSKCSIDLKSPNQELPEVYLVNESFGRISEASENFEKLENIEKFLKMGEKLVKSKIFFPSESEESEDPLFLSDRISYECDSEQSLKFEKHKIETFGSIKDSEVKKEVETRIADQFTQTERFELEMMMNSLDPNDIRTGMEFLTKIYNLLQPLSKS